ncbi:MAG: hypothetical protein AB8G18_19235 [Gammaproteobacteria bacterium]
MTVEKPIVYRYVNIVRSRIFSLFTLSVLVFVSGCATTAPMDIDELYSAATSLKNSGELNNRQKAKVFQMLESCAQQGHGGCAEVLGWSYYEGDLGPDNLELSERWLRVAADTEDRFGMAGIAGYISLAEIYCDNHEFEKSPEEIADVLLQSEALSERFRRFLQTDTWVEEQRLSFLGMLDGVDSRIFDVHEKLDQDKCARRDLR